MRFDVDGRSNRIGQFDQIIRASDIIEFPVGFEPVGNSQIIDGATRFEKLKHRPENILMFRIVKHFGRQLVNGFRNGPFVNKHGTQNGFFHFDGLRRYLRTQR